MKTGRSFTGLLAFHVAVLGMAVPGLADQPVAAVGGPPAVAGIETASLTPRISNTLPPRLRSALESSLDLARFRFVVDDDRTRTEQVEPGD
jgi:hypothetical protein